MKPIRNYGSKILMMISLDLMVEIKFVDSVLLINGSEVLIIFEVTYNYCIHIFMYIYKFCIKNII